MTGIEDSINKDLQEYIDENEELFMVNGVTNTQARRNLQCIVDLVRDCYQNKKMNLLGCKMKIYQERLRQMQFLEVISRFKQVKEYEQVGNIKLIELKNLLAICENQAKLY